MSIKGFKAMNSNMTCRGFKFKVGKTYESDNLTMCSNGFHFCENALDVYNYYEKSSDTVVCEVEALGEVLKEGDKSVTNKIKIIRQLTDKDLVDLWIKRTNSGYRNSGDWNSGDGNSGDGNGGDGNSGNGNSGYGNSGNGNSGNRNSGDWNSGDGNSGYFNTTVPVYMFNKPTDFKYTKEFENRVRSFNVKPVLEWVPTSMMSESELKNFPSHKTTGGFLRKTDRHDWRGLSEEDRNFIKNLPNFDDELFKQISGMSLSDDVEITANGITKKISKAKAKELGLID